MTELAPAILSNDIEDFRKKYSELLALSHYFTKMHVDFCDGEFVPTKTIYPKDITFFRSSKLEFTAHLMTQEPQRFFEDCKIAGFSWVVFHYEAFADEEQIQPAINEAESKGLKVGIAVNAETPLLKVAKFMYRAKMIQLMGINPGAQGRTFKPETIDKIKELRALSSSVIICVDGGIRVGIAGQCEKAGADILVTGSAILASEDRDMALESLKLDLEINA